MTARILSLAALTVLELAPPEMVSCAAQAGFSHLGLRLLPVMPEDVVHPVIGDTPMLREVLKRLDDTGVRVLDVEFIRIRPETRVEDYVPMLETAARLGAQHVLAAGNDPDVRRLGERFGEFCDAAAPLGLTVNLEPIPMTEVRTLAQACAVLRVAARANCGIVVDPIHFDRAGDGIDDLARVPREWLRYMQFCDAPAERPADAAALQFQARYQRMIPGEGGLDLVGLLRALPRALPIALEVPLADLARSAGAVERACRVRDATLALLRRIENGERHGATG